MKRKVKKRLRRSSSVESDACSPSAMLSTNCDSRIVHAKFCSRGRGVRRGQVERSGSPGSLTAQIIRAMVAWKNLE